MSITPRATTLDEYIALVVKHLRTPADSINEAELYEWCFQKWCGRLSSGYSESTAREHAKKFDRQVLASVSFNPEHRSDRHRKTSTRTA